MFRSRYMPCPECGGSVDRIAESGHRCTPERLFDFQMFRLRGEIGAVETQVHSYLATSWGKFETWVAARQVRGGR